MISEDISGQSGKTSGAGEGTIGASVWVHFTIDILRGGFHTDIKSAKALRDALNSAIETAESS